MSMFVTTKVNDELIAALSITNVTENLTGLNTYRWVYTRHDLGLVNSLMSAQEGEIEHVREDGAMALISKVALAASKSETP